MHHFPYTAGSLRASRKSLYIRRRVQIPVSISPADSLRPTPTDSRMVTVRVALLLCCACLATAQIPSLGGCPEYAPMADFDMSRYLGVWYEAERYFTMLEVASRCVYTNYTQGLDGKYHVSNQITNRLTGVKRIVDGELRSVGKAGEGRLTVKYTTLPVSFDTTFNVLETDYDTFSVMWSCSNLGVVNTQNAWVMTRDRLASSAVLQRAYGVLDKYKISRTFFMKTDQQDCAILEASPVSSPAGEEAGSTASPSTAADPAQAKGEKHSFKSAGEEPEAVPAPAPIAAPEIPPTPEAQKETIAPVEPAVNEDPKKNEESAPIAAPAGDEVKAEAPAPVVEPAKVETLVPQIPAKVQAAKNQIRKKVQV